MHRLPAFATQHIGLQIDQAQSGPQQRCFDMRLAVLVTPAGIQAHHIARCIQRFHGENDHATGPQRSGSGGGGP
ncbi:hypothetical protein XVE_5069, partial [Xanthomonas vesicatoria ATCC 35937]